MNLKHIGKHARWSLAINNANQIIGWSYINGNLTQDAMPWSGVSVSDLGTLGGSFSQATGINDLGQIVGVSSTSNNASNHATL